MASLLLVLTCQGLLPHPDPYQALPTPSTLQDPTKMDTPLLLKNMSPGAYFLNFTVF